MPTSQRRVKLKEKARIQAFHGNLSNKSIVRHGLMLPCFKDLMNVTEKLQQLNI